MDGSMLILLKEEDLISNLGLRCNLKEIKFIKVKVMENWLKLKTYKLKLKNSLNYNNF
jgi:hypothetical protein